MTVRDQNYCAGKSSSSLLKLSSDLSNCICDPWPYSHGGADHLTGWGLPDQKTADRRRQGGVSRTPRKLFPSRIYEAGASTACDSRSNEYVFRHYENVGSYMEQYRQDHTVMYTGRTLRQAPDEMVVFLPSRRPASNSSSTHGARKTDRLRLPSVRDKRSVALLPATVTNIDQHGGNTCRVREDSPKASPRETHSNLSVSRQNGQPAPHNKTLKSKGKSKSRQSKLGNGAVTIDSYTGGTFVNIVGELRAELSGSKLNRIGAKTESVSPQGNSWFSLESSRSHHLRTSSFGGMVPSAEGGLNDIKQPINCLGRDDVTQTRTHETWDSLWRDNFRTPGRLIIKSATCGGGQMTRLKTYKLENKQTDCRRASISEKEDNGMQDIALETGSITMTNYSETRAVFQANSFRGTNRHDHVTTKARLPISQQRRAPPLSRDTVVVGRGSPLRTGEKYCIDN